MFIVPLHVWRVGGSTFRGRRWWLPDSRKPLAEFRNPAQYQRGAPLR